MSEALPEWTEWLSLLGTPLIAAAAASIAGANLWLAHRKRKDDLFDRRYSLLDEILTHHRGIYGCIFTQKNIVAGAQIEHDLVYKIAGPITPKMETQIRLLFGDRFLREIKNIVPDRNSLMTDFDGKASGIVDLFKAKML